MSYELSDVEILFIIFLSTKFGISILLAAITLTISKKVNKTANNIEIPNFVDRKIIKRISTSESS